MARQKHYYPPSLPEIGQFVEIAFNVLRERDPLFSRPEVEQGLTQFLWVSAIILAKHLNSTNRNEDSCIDTDSK